jgi:hypothetical protein
MAPDRVRKLIEGRTGPDHARAAGRQGGRDRPDVRGGGGAGRHPARRARGARGPAAAGPRARGGAGAGGRARTRRGVLLGPAGGRRRGLRLQPVVGREPGRRRVRRPRGFHAYRDGDFAAARRYWGARPAPATRPPSSCSGTWPRPGSARRGAPAPRPPGTARPPTGATPRPPGASAGCTRPAWAWRPTTPRPGAGSGRGRPRPRRGRVRLGRSWMRELGIAWARDGVGDLAGRRRRGADRRVRARRRLGFHEAAPYAASLAAARPPAGLP